MITIEPASSGVLWCLGFFRLAREPLRYRTANQTTSTVTSAVKKMVRAVTSHRSASYSPEKFGAIGE